MSGPIVECQGARSSVWGHECVATCETSRFVSNADETSDLVYVFDLLAA